MEINLGEISLEAELHKSTSANSPFFVLSHPHPVYGGTMTNKVIDQFFRRAVERDYSVLRYNMRGIGQSTGAYDKGIGEEQDLQNLIQWIHRQKISMSQMVLVGYSFGSWLTAKVAAKSPSPCVLIAPPVSLYSFPVLDSNQHKLVFSAGQDDLIPQEKIRAYVENISEPKTHVSIEKADHYFIGTTTELIRSLFQTLDQTVL